MADVPHPFRPAPCYSRAGDQLRWYWDDSPGFARPIVVGGVHVGSLIVSLATGLVVGVKINGVAALVRGEVGGG